jgi:hypothetical protein
LTARPAHVLGIVVALVGAAVTVAGVVLAVRTTAAVHETQRIQRGPRVLAVIDLTGRVSGHHQRVTLHYVDRGGHGHEVDVRYPLGLAESVIVGMSTSVVYDPRAPARAELAGHPRHDWWDVVVAAALAALATGIWLRWFRALLIAGARERREAPVRLGPPGSVERAPPPRLPRAHAYGTLAVLSVLLLVGGRLVTQLAAADRPQEVAFPPLPVLPEHRGPAVLPGVLTAPVPDTGPLVTPSRAASVVAAAWRFRDRALARHDVVELRAVDTEPVLAVDAADLKDGRAPNRPVPAPGDLHDLTVYAPRQNHWPLGILGEAVTTVAGDPALELMVLTRRGPKSSWRIAFDTTVTGDAAYTPRVEPPILDADGYDVVPAVHWIEPRAVVPALARYWQSLRESGRPPEGGVTFAPGHWTDEYGKSIANRQGTRDRNGLDSHVAYGDRLVPATQVWSFGVYGDWTLVCSPMHETKTWSGHAHQDAERQKWGGDLAPGVYRSVTSEFVREVCALVPPAPGPPGIAVFGADAWIVGTRGTR